MIRWILAVSLFAGVASAQMELHGHRGPSHEPQMSHGYSFHIRQIAGFNHQSGPRGGQSAAGENYQLFSYRGSFGPVTVEPHIMTSLEPWTLPHKGSPQLFQSGGTYNSEPLADRQYPQNLWLEITETLIYELAPHSSVYVRGGPVGSPALGPEAFMRRESARHLPWTPLGHRDQDSTHVSRGILTSGLKFDIVEVALSQFNSREPDEMRTNLGRGKLDSWATQIKLYLWEGLYGQASTGILKAPLTSDDRRRTTASVHWQSGQASSATGFRHSSSFIYGSTKNISSENQNENEPEEVQAIFRKSWLVESDLTWGDNLWWMGRFESLEKLKALTLGGFADIEALSTSNIKSGLGADITGHLIDTDQRKEYGSFPFGAHVFLMVNAGW